MRSRIFILVVTLMLCLGITHTVLAERENGPADANVNPEAGFSGYVTADNVNLRSGPGTTAAVKTVLSQGTAVTILEIRDLWARVRLTNQTEGWVYQDFIKSGTSYVNNRNRAEAVIGYARRYIGSRYRYGGTSAQGFDCSGFTRFIFTQFGFDLPHNAAAQYQCGSTVSKIDLHAGDLVFFATLGAKYINHVGIYIGGGEFIQASSGSGRVRISPLDEGYYANCYRGARRLLAPGAWENQAEEPTPENTAEIK